jgi:capsular exopolysaccharide synthesis family protein
MANTYKALNKAEKEFQKDSGESRFDSEERHWLAMPDASEVQIPFNRVLDLKSKLLTRYAGDAVKTILVTGTTHGSGASTTSVGLATALTKDARLKVLLMDANFRTPGLHEVFKTECARGLYDVISTENDNSVQFKKVGPGELYLLSSGVNSAAVNGYFEGRRFDRMVQSARKAFHYVILDSAPVGRFPDAQAICSRVDGVILVIEAGITRLQVAQRAKKELEDAGGRILGVVLTKRKRYIPEWIYKRL